MNLFPVYSFEKDAAELDQFSSDFQSIEKVVNNRRYTIELEQKDIVLRRLPNDFLTYWYHSSLTTSEIGIGVLRPVNRFSEDKVLIEVKLEFLYQGVFLFFVLLPTVTGLYLATANLIAGIVLILITFIVGGWYYSNAKRGLHEFKEFLAEDIVELNRAFAV